MASTVPVTAACPQCQGAALACRFNFFDRGDLQIHSWEHRCTNCGWRETQAFRSDAPEAAAPDLCPWCGRRGT